MAVSIEQARRDRPSPEIAPAPAAGSKAMSLKFDIQPAANPVSEKDRAAKLLATSADLPVKDVSGMCGFEDPNYFAKVFRRGFGVSPTEFRTTGMYASTGHQQSKGWAGSKGADLSLLTTAPIDRR